MAPFFTGFTRGLGGGGFGKRAGGNVFIPPLPFSVSGGTVDTSSRPGLTIRTFTSPGTFTIQGATGNIEIMLVAGGGAGQAGGTGGGGGGGTVIYHPAVPMSASLTTPLSYTVTVGNAGGNGGYPGSPAPSQPGGDSEFYLTSLGPGPSTSSNGLRAKGGGGGGGPNSSTPSPPYAGQSGGNGGGGGTVGSWSGGTSNQPSVTQSIPGATIYGGYSGGLGGSPQDNKGGGGGGAGGTGGASVDGPGGRAGNGGAGVNLSITGSSVNYGAGGGGGGSGKWSGPGGQWWGGGGSAGGPSAGVGGGSSDGSVGGQTNGAPGVTNRGGGGGATGYGVHSYNGTVANPGGSGVVVIVHTPTGT
jgi:hypothetical protein